MAHAYDCKLYDNWTDERVASMRKWWLDGQSASEIAKQLGGVTRNAVIGKVHRLGIAGRATPSRPAKRPVRSARPRIWIAKRKALPAETPAPLEPLNTSILDIGQQQCKAVVDQTEWGRAKCCGHTTEPGRSFCAAHEAIFFTMQDRSTAA